MALTAASVTLVLSSCQKKSAQDEAADMAAFTPPGGFQWEGTYLDSIGDLAVLNIERDNNAYYCSISIPDQDITYIESYEFKAVPAEDGLGLLYTGGVHTSYQLPAAGKEDSGVITRDIYDDGTGRIYYLDGNVFWLDEKDNAGSSLIFERVESTEGVSENNVE